MNKPELLNWLQDEYQHAVIESLPDDVVIEPDWHLVWVNDQRFPAGEFFDHFHDDHEADVRAWLRA
ncbi:MAG TPA: hypothetical protein VLC95_09220 [Anaerolineae bacterium]|nr:hypothetical protein [Anaerolineae bacterium]